MQLQRHHDPDGSPDPPPDMSSRFRGCSLGLACGDAVGTTVEFKSRGSFRPLTDMIGGGPFGLLPGQWTDDTSMALCLAMSLLECHGFDARDQMDRYLRWWREGYLSSTGRCFDIGNTIRAALARYERTDDPFSGSTDPHSAGNGSLMRLAPVAMFYVEDLPSVLHYAAESSRTTHATREAVDACRLFALMLAMSLRGASSKRAVLVGDRADLLPSEDLAPTIAEIAAGSYQDKPSDQIKASGYVVHSLEAALWSFATTDSFREAILRAANLGEDADTTAAICGQIAGAFYGVEAIPNDWLERLHSRERIDDLAAQLYARRPQPDPSRDVGSMP